MKRLLLVFTLGAALASPSFAQPADSSTVPPSGPSPSITPPPGPPLGGGGQGHHDLDFLTDAEKQEFHKAQEAAVAADPSLGTERQSLMEQMKQAHESGTKPSDDLLAQMRAFREKMDAAMIKADPNVAPILEKIKAHQPHGGPGGGAPPPPPAGA